MAPVAAALKYLS